MKIWSGLYGDIESLVEITKPIKFKDRIDCNKNKRNSLSGKLGTCPNPGVNLDMQTDSNSGTPSLIGTTLWESRCHIGNLND